MVTIAVLIVVLFGFVRMVSHEEDEEVDEVGTGWNAEEEDDEQHEWFEVDEDDG